jgi:regulation of enolase protein 1 (concanavalin A-like superfamily)
LTGFSETFPFAGNNLRLRHQEPILHPSPMKTLLPISLSSVLLIIGAAKSDDVLFQDDFQGKLGEGWSWVREHREAWRVTGRGLEVRIEPGNMWGPANDARNVLVRPAPDAANEGIEISVNVENRPTSQYEQADLVWYFDDGHMVKLGQELVDGKLSIVMGREENDKTRTVAIIPLESFSVRLRLAVKGNRIHGQFRTPVADEWREAGECDLPVPPDAKAKISLQFYQGPDTIEHWAHVTEFRIRRLGK